MKKHYLFRLIIGMVFIFNMLGTSMAKNNSVNIAFLSKLTDTPGASGFEGPVRNILKKEWKPLLNNIQVDGIGNLYGKLPGTGGKPKVVLLAHMDEVGLIVRNITEKGFIHFIPMGGWVNQALLTQRWIIMTPKGPVSGYTGVESGHIIPTYPKVPLISQGKMFIDIGARNRDEVIKKDGIRPGLPITPDTRFVVLKNDHRYMAKAFDDRAALAVITSVIKHLKKSKIHPNTLYAAASVQEELGMRGAETLYNDIKPDVVINLEAGAASDFPLLATSCDTNLKLGKGPAIWVYSASALPDNHLVNWVVSIAKKYHIPIQYEANMINGGSDIASIQTKGHGIPVVTLAIPVRYMHSQSGIIDRDDYLNMIKLVDALINNLSQSTLKKVKGR